MVPLLAVIHLARLTTLLLLNHHNNLEKHYYKQKGCNQAHVQGRPDIAGNVSDIQTEATAMPFCSPRGALNFPSHSFVIQFAILMERDQVAQGLKNVGFPRIPWKRVAAWVAGLIAAADTRIILNTV